LLESSEARGERVQIINTLISIWRYSFAFSSSSIWDSPQLRSALLSTNEEELCSCNWHHSNSLLISLSKALTPLSLARSNCVALHLLSAAGFPPKQRQHNYQIKTRSQEHRRSTSGWSIQMFRFQF
jgi:hypothetical protein